MERTVYATVVRQNVLTVPRPGQATGKWECPGVRETIVLTRAPDWPPAIAATGAVMKVGSTARYARNAGISQPFPSGSTTTGWSIARPRDTHCCYLTNVKLFIFADLALQTTIQCRRSNKVGGEQMSLETL